MNKYVSSVKQKLRRPTFIVKWRSACDKREERDSRDG